MTRWGILSTARINQMVLAGAAESSEIEIVAVASRDRARAEAYARENAIARGYGSYEELLADPLVEAVYISLPNSFHAPWAIRALEAGKHVLVEKPLSSRPSEVEDVFDAAERAGRVCMEAFMWRHNPQTKKVASLVRDGAIGDVRTIRAAFSFAIDNGPNVRLQPDLDGGALMDIGCYCISGARLLGGEPVRVTAQRVVAPSGVDIRTVATLALDGGAVATFDCAMDTPYRAQLEVGGSEGYIRVPDPWHIRRPEILLVRDDEPQRIATEPANSYRLEMENLGAAIRGEAEPLLGRADALGQARAIQAVRRAAESGEAMEL